MPTFLLISFRFLVKAKWVGPTSKVWFDTQCPKIKSIMYESGVWSGEGFLTSPSCSGDGPACAHPLHVGHSAEISNEGQSPTKN